MIRPLLLACTLASACASAPARDRDIAAITDLACRNDVVLLGELPSHGEATAFELKARIVQDLVQRCGVDAVLFEAPIYDFVGFNEAIRQNRADTTQLSNAIGRFWLTRELGPFRMWLFDRARAGRLVVGGVDDQVSVTSHYARSRLPTLLAGTCRETVARNLNWTYSDAQPFDRAEQQRLQTCAGTDIGTDVMRRNLASYVARQVNAPAARTRDDVMFDNLRWHLTQLPKNSKVVVWTATVHAARIQGELSYKPLGAHLANAGYRVASIGFTALAGESSMAGRPPRRLPDLPANSLEAQTSIADNGWTFLASSRLADMGAVPSRLLGKVVAARWNDYFDGVVVIRSEVAPTF